MFDMSSEFYKFYRNEVVLPADTQNELREKKKLNIKRLKDGLLEYNSENGTTYKICEERVQGSMAMHTVVQNDSNDYDIDVAIVFEKEVLGDLGPLATRNMVANALKRKTKQFNTEPEVKTSCVRVRYVDGYHIDFAVYRRYKQNPEDTNYVYEHAGAKWSVRDIRAIEDWFKNETKEKGNRLRQIIRFSKMFCKSRDTWVNMVSGIVQTVICDEKLAEDTRIDELFYHTMEEVVSRLEDSTDVEAPVDNSRPLVTRDIDRTRVTNWKKRLSGQLENLLVLFEDACTYEKAVSAWNKFFSHTFWAELVQTAIKETDSYNLHKSQVVTFRNTEQFIEDMYIVDEQYEISIECKVIGKGFTLMKITDFFENFSNRFGGFIPHNFKVRCKAIIGRGILYDKILWKVKNEGAEAERRDDIRGQIVERGLEISETTLFRGKHFIECYLIKNNVCIAIGYVSVPIGDV